MKRFLVVSSFVLSFINCMAQPGSGYVRDAYQNKYEQENAGNKQKGMDWMANMMNGKTEPSYSFNTSVNMHVTTYDDGTKKNESDIKYYLTNGSQYFGFNGMQENSKKRNSEDMFMIYDSKNMSTVMLNEKEKTGMAININSFRSAKAQAGDNNPKGESNVKCNKSGRTKTILGYNCAEYVCIDEDRNRKTEMWATTEIKIDISQSFARGQYSYLSNSGGVGGFMMEASHYKNNILESKLEVTDVNKSINITKNMSDYKMGMGAMK